MNTAFPGKGNKHDISESQLSQEWPAREHKWRPISIQAQIMIAPGKPHSPGGFWVFYKYLQSAWPVLKGWFLLLWAVPATCSFHSGSFHHLSTGCAAALLTLPLVALDSAASAFDIWTALLHPHRSWPTEGQISANSPHMLVLPWPAV